MKIDKEKVKERLEGIPEAQRSHIYDASIVLEFLTEIYMPTSFFLPASFKPQPGMQLGANSMRKVSEGKNISMYDLYNNYLLWRERKDYTTKVQSRYIFGIIIRNLRYYKNRWEFITWRVGVAQIWHVGPLVLRSDVPAEVRAQFTMKVEDRTPEAITVEADPISDPDEEVEDPIIGVDLATGEENSVFVHGHTDAAGVLHITKVDERFVEVPEIEEIKGAAGEPLSEENFKGTFGVSGLSQNRFVEVPDQPDINSQPHPAEQY